MRKWAWLVVCFVGLILAWFTPSLIEGWLGTRRSPADLAWEVKINGNHSQLAVDAEQRILSTGPPLVQLDGQLGIVRWTQPVVLPNVATYEGDIFLVGAEDHGHRAGPIAPPFSGRNTDFAVCKVLGRDGTVAWKRSFDGGLRDTDWAEWVIIASDGNPICAGFTPDDARYVGCIAKADSQTGSIVWQYRTAEASVELWHGSSALAVDQHSGVFFGSSRKPPGAISSEISFWITKLREEDGRPLWTSEFPSDGPKRHMLTHLAANKEGNLIAVGYHAKSHGRSLMVACFSGLDGHLIWSDERDAASYETIEPTSLVIDEDGRIFIAASSWNGSLTNPVFDRWVFHLAANDGNDVWVHREAGSLVPFAAGDICSTQKLMAAPDELIVCAGSVWNGKNADVKIEWLSRVDGKIVRSMQYDGAAHDHDLYRDVALLATGEVVVLLRSSRCPEWLKPFRRVQHLMSGGIDWRVVHREKSRIDDPDPYNYDSVIVKTQIFSP